MHTDIQYNCGIKISWVRLLVKNNLKGSLSGDRGKVAENKIEKHCSNLMQEFSEETRVFWQIFLVFYRLYKAINRKDL